MYALDKAREKAIPENGLSVPIWCPRAESNHGLMITNQKNRHLSALIYVDWMVNFNNNIMKTNNLRINIH